MDDDLNEILGFCQPGPVVPAAAQQLAARPTFADRVFAVSATADDDIPEAASALPADIVLEFSTARACFNTGCSLDLVKLCTRLRMFEYNPRNSPQWMIGRLCEPNVTVMLARRGCVQVLCNRQPGGFAGVDDIAQRLKDGAKRLLRLIHRTGYPEAVCENFRVISMKSQSDLKFPVRLRQLAEKWHRHVRFDPEVCVGLFFYLQNPRCSVRVTESGHVSIDGSCSSSVAEGGQQAYEALTKLYPIFRAFAG